MAHRPAQALLLPLLAAVVCLASASPAAGGGEAPLDGGAVRSLVVERHPAVAEARAALREAEALRRGAGSWPDPELEGRVLWNSGGDSDIEGALLFALPWSGRLAAAREAADLEIELARLELASAAHRAAVEADRLLARLAWSRSLVELHEALSARSSEQARMASQRREANIADPLEVSLVLADAARDRRALIESRNKEAAISAELLLLAGLPPGGAVIATGPLGWDKPAVDREALLAAAREHAPALAGARLRLERAERKVSESGRARLPDLRLGPAVQREQSGTSWGLAVGLPLPLFGQTGAALEAARARHQGAEQSLDLENRALPVRVETLLQRLAALELQLADLNGDAADATEQAFNLARARWSAGTFDVLHLLSAHRAFAELRIERLDTLLRLNEAWLDLSLAVGQPPDAVESTATETGQ